MRTVLAFSLAAVLAAGCASAPPAPPPDALLASNLFGPPTEPVSTDDVFAMSAAMRRYLAIEIADQLHSEGLQAGLVKALQHQAQLKLAYDTARHKKAAEAFDTRTGNRLSLVIMTRRSPRRSGCP
jgi:hypothetical protein